MQGLWGRRLWSRRLRFAAAAAPDGPHRLPGAGRGLDLAGIRPFEPGDDPRRIDARASARRGFPHVREDGPCLSQTLHFVIEGLDRLGATPAAWPSRIPAMVIESLAPVALDCGDPVALTVLGSGGIIHRQASRHPAAAAACLADLKSPAPSTGSVHDLWPGLIGRGSLALVVTDGLSPTLSRQISDLPRRVDARLLLVRNPWLGMEPPSVAVFNGYDGTTLPAPSPREWAMWKSRSMARMNQLRASFPAAAEVSRSPGPEFADILANLLAGSP
ncbi:MAG: DUF58 domain-containing protein [Planctomycetota bacterium]